MDRFGSTPCATAILVAAFSFGGHFIFAIDHHSGAALQRAGALWTLIGAALAGWSYLQPSTITAQAAERVPALPASFVFSPQFMTSHTRTRQRAIKDMEKVIVAERYVAFALICAGTLMNGYGDLVLGARF